ncbi:MAG: hypothetical protein MJ187_05110, partial [Alphaproteobacteria bacterium]|nr:hypothetical protein [Alphaproteobacteria bacterium]
MTIKFYIFIGLIIGFVAAFYVGQYTGKLICRENVAVKLNVNNQQNNQIIGKINAETLHTGTDDIRCILREQYSIAE